MPTNELTLHDVATDLRTWADTIDGLDEGTPEREQALAEQSKSITTGKDKAESFGRFLQRCEAEQAFAKSEAARLNARAKSFETLVDKLKAYAVSAMEENQVKRIDGHTLALVTRACPASVVVTDEAAVPSSYKTLVLVVTADAWEEHLAKYLSMAKASQDHHYQRPCLECEGAGYFGSDLKCDKCHGHGWLETIPVTTQIKVDQVKIDKAGLKKDLQAGDVIPGADLSFGRSSLSIK